MRYRLGAAAGRVREESPPYAGQHRDLSRPADLPRSSPPIRAVAKSGLLGCIQNAFVDLRRAAAAVVAREAEVWLLAAEAEVHLRAGYRCLGDFARETLSVSPRTVRRRLQLARVLAKSPPLAEAFHDGRVGSCQALTLAPVLGAESDPFWVGIAERLSVNELRNAVRESRADLADDPGEDAAARTLGIEAPAAVAVAWEQAVETARKMLGWQAPRHACFSAMLSEAEASIWIEAETEADAGAGVEADASFPTIAGVSLASSCEPVPDAPSASPQPDRGRRPLGGAGSGAARVQSWSERAGSWTPSPAAVNRARSTLSLVADELAELHALIADAGTPDPATHLRALQGLSRPLRLLRARLVHDARDLGVPFTLGYSSLGRFVESELGLSERAARDLVAEASVFPNDPDLESAFVTGRVSGAQGRLVARLASGGDVAPWIRRAESVTRLQFEREAHWLGRCRELLPRLGVTGPFPHAALESRLVDLLQDLGWNRDEIHDQVPGSQRGSGAPADDDPARDPALMTRVEVLLDLCVLAVYPDGVTGDPLSRVGEADRQTLASLDPTPSRPNQRDAHRYESDPFLAGDDPTKAGLTAERALADSGSEGVPADLGDERPMADLASERALPDFGAEPTKADPGGPASLLRRQTLASAGFVRLGILLPPDTHTHWVRVRRAIESRQGPSPTWAVFGAVICHALAVWENHDPERRPTEWAILERDGYRCTAPGCSSRHSLEAHHVVFRSHQGSDAPTNLTTLCATHHRLGVHAGVLRLEGAAPSALRWSLGVGTPFADTFLGHLRI